MTMFQTRAERKGDDLIINGQKMWTTNGCQADWICLLANTNKGPPHKNKSLICVPMNTKGLTQQNARVTHWGIHGVKGTVTAKGRKRVIYHPKDRP